MTCAAHAILAGAVGAIARSRSRAFLAGVGTHLLADLVPHRDFGPAVELVMVAAALAAVGRVAGFDSPAFAGSVGGAAPDLENGLDALGMAQCPCFPTHRHLHGRRVREVWSQIAVSCAAFGVILWRGRQGKHPR